MKLAIIGGLGAFASAYFHKLFLETYVRNKNLSENDFPHIILDSYNYSSMDETGIYDEIIFEKEVENRIRTISKIDDFNFFFTICYSASNIVSKITDNLKLNSVNLINETESIIDGFFGQSFLILSSKYTNDLKLIKSNNNEIIYLNDNDQKILDTLINKAIFNKLSSIEKSDIFNILKNYKFKKIILACSELPIIFDYLLIKKDVINPLTTITNKIIN